MGINSGKFPLTVDLQVWKDIKNENLKNHLLRVGQVFYSVGQTGNHGEKELPILRVLLAKD